jgi:hypothetical protein
MAKVDAGDHSQSVWAEFSKRHRGNPFLNCDPLYALTEPLIKAIKIEVPAFFTRDQEGFEHDLARTASFGFFHRRALGLSKVIDQADPKTGLSLQERHERSAHAINELLAEELRRDGLTEDEIVAYLQERADERKVIEDLKNAYVGWLISNQDFHSEVRKLKASWEEVVLRLGGFPAYPRWPFVDDAEERPGEFREACCSFYRRWGLDRLLTWDWPVPMEPDLAVGMLRDMPRLSDAGIVVFVPWYLLRGEKLNLQEVAQHARTASEARHLWGWLQKPASQGSEAIGNIRFQRLQSIYRYYQLALIRRYSSASRHNVQRLDRALAKVMGRDEDTVKKLRLELNRALRSK